MTLQSASGMKKKDYRSKQTEDENQRVSLQKFMDAALAAWYLFRNKQLNSLFSLTSNYQLSTLNQRIF